MPLPVELPISKHFPKERQEEIAKYVDDRLSALTQSLRQLREDKITQWRRIYMGMPKEKVKSFPWQNASNMVVQLVGSYVDQLKAKFLMSIFGMDPLFEVELNGTWDRTERAEEQREALQAWRTYTGLESSKLNLLPKYEAWASTIIRYGMGAIKLLPARTVEQVATTVTSSGSIIFEEHVRHDGPVALPLIFEDFLIPLTVDEIEHSPFTAQRARMSRFDLEAMKYDKTYDKAAVIKVLGEPDRVGSERTEQELKTDQGVQSSSGDPTADEWDIYECYFPYQVAGKTFQLICTYHLTSKSMLKAVFNWLPENSIPFIKGVLGYDGERSYGFGFCEMLKDYQEEVSAIHNRRGDASTLANTNIFRVGSGTQLDAQFSVFPNAIFPGETGAFEAVPLGRTASETIKDESMTLQLATDRAGVGPSASGSGSGSVSKKGTYSAMGTYAIMQEGDTRANLNKTSFKQAHVLLGRQATLYDAYFGIPENDLKSLGKQADHLKKALENIKSHRLSLPIRAATGSINKEVEKQNLMLLLNNVRSHWQMETQMLQASENPMLSPMQKDYLLQTVIAGNMLMTKIIKEFGISDPSAILPEPAGIQIESDQMHQQILHQKARQIAQSMMENQQQTGQGQPQASGQPNQPAQTQAQPQEGQGQTPAQPAAQEQPPVEPTQGGTAQ
jgi:hypothetical protein